ASQSEDADWAPPRWEVGLLAILTGSGVIGVDVPWPGSYVGHGASILWRSVARCAAEEGFRKTAANQAVVSEAFGNGD
ncbi:hypothetical protein THAOC_22287, partial [Thalassiosira oceanica]